MSVICILGAGRVASVLAAGLSAAGHRVQIGTRHPDRPAKNWSGPSVAMTDPESAIAGADFVINATPGETSVAFLANLSNELCGKILVDVSNAVRRDARGMPAGLAYPDGSVAEELQKALPQTKVVKTLNTMMFVIMAAPQRLTNMPSAFLSGNDARAKAAVRRLLADLNWPDAAIEDLGTIESARGPEAFMHFVPHLFARDGMVPFALSITR